MDGRKDANFSESRKGMFVISVGEIVGLVFGLWSEKFQVGPDGP
jgi:hypothetical protein